jgi:uncharacterized membrane protein YphA (DoxX/SURF4 family)
MDSYPNKPLRWILLALRILLGAIFVYAGYVKLRDPWQVFAMAIDNYHLVPFRYLHLLSLAIPWFEVVVGLLLIFGRFLRISAAAVSLTLGFFFCVMLHAFLNHQEIDCGCFGPGGGPISQWTLLRDGSMLAGSLFLTWMALRSPRRMA